MEAFMPTTKPNWAHDKRQILATATELGTPSITTVSITTSLVYPQLNLHIDAKGPLTAIFTPPEDCTSLTYAPSRSIINETKNEMYFFPSVWRIFPEHPETKWASCYPPNFTDVKGWWYSPGACPKSWEATSYQHYTLALSNGKPPDNTAMCCPPGFHFKERSDGALRGLCLSGVTSATNAMLSAGNSSTVLPVNNGTVYAMPVYLRWQDNDTIKPTFFDTPSMNGTHIVNHLSAGEVIAMGIGLAILTLALLLLSVCFILNRRKMRIAAVSVPPVVSEKADYYTTPDWGKAELDGTRKELIELPTNRSLPELPGCPYDSELSELEGDSDIEPTELEGSPVVEMASRSTQKHSRNEHGIKCK